MKRIATIAAIIAAAAGGHVARDYSNVGPLIDPPKATAIAVRGPEEGFAGREYFFHAELKGDHGRPAWIVSPECDISTNDEGTLCRLRCDQADMYTLTVTVGGKDATVAADVKHFNVVDLEAEIDQAVAQATASATSEQMLLPEQIVAQSLLHSPNLPDQSLWPTGARALLDRAELIQAGLTPSDANPLALIQGVLGEEWRGFLEDFAAAVNGQVTTAATYEPFLRAVASALSQ